MKNNISAQVAETIRVRAHQVWEALTTPSIIKQYFFGTDTETDWKVGSPIKFSGEYQGKQYQDKGNILEFEPEKKIKYSYWSSMSGIEDKPENYVPVTYEVEENNGYTIVTITQENIPSEEMKQHSAENWSKVLKSLKDLLELKK